ncbi:hypothetical protein ACFCYI_15050 [Streptomyces sp. NPDC056257]|uniref:hypothetical protein n=1 Tax=Streptomyces sp. NPDC056257 TaxID=3345765 RepID=UPI0035DDFCA9
MPAKPPATSPVTSRRLMAIAAAALIAAAAPATFAYAAPSAGVSPTTVAPGGRVALNLDGCGTRIGRATSTAFSEVRLTPGNAEATNLFGSATVFRDANPGTHRVTFECGGGERVTVSLQVASGAARGGTGGSIGSMSPGQVAVGGALAAGALGAGIWVLRRRAAGTGAA